MAYVDAKLDQEKQFQKMASIVESLEALLFDAVKAKGWMWVNEEPLWTTWSLERFGMCALFIPVRDKLEELHLQSPEHRHFFHHTIVPLPCVRTLPINYRATPYCLRIHVQHCDSGLHNHAYTKVVGKNGTRFAAQKYRDGETPEIEIHPG